MAAPAFPVDAAGKPIDPGSIEEAVKSGKWLAPEGASLPMRQPDGSTVEVSGDQIQAAINAGAIPLTLAEQQAKQEAVLQEQRGGFGEMAKAFGEAAVQSVPVVGQPLLNILGGEEGRQAQIERRQANPITSVAGSLAGIAAQIYASGGLGAAGVGGRAAAATELAGAARAAGAGERLGVGAEQAIAGAGRLAAPAAEVAGETALAGRTGATMFAPGAAPSMATGARQVLGTPWQFGVRMPGQIAGGMTESALRSVGMVPKAAEFGGRVGQMAAEGGAMGLYGEVAESDLHDTPLQGEKIAHAIAVGALMGTAAEAGLSGLGFAGRKVFGRAASAKGLEDIANESAFFSTRARPADARLLPGGEEAAKRIGERLRTYQLTGETGGSHTGPVMTRAARNIDMPERVAQAMDESNARLIGVKADVNEAVALRPDLNPDMKGFFAKVKKDVIDPLDSSLVPDVQGKADEIRKLISVLEEKHIAATVGEAVPQRLTSADRAAAEFTKSELGDFGAILEVNRKQLGDALESGKFNAFAKTVAAELRNARAAIPDHVSLPALKAELMDRPKFWGQLLKDDPDNFFFSLSDHFGGPVPARRYSLRMGPPVSFDDMLAFRSDLASRVYPRRRPNQGLPTPIPFSVEEQRVVERIAAETIRDSGERALVETGRNPAQWQNANREVSDWIMAKQLIDKAAMADAHQRLFSLSDMVVGHGGITTAAHALFLGHVGTAGAAIAAPFVHKVFRERGQAMLSTAAGRLAQAIRVSDARVAGAVQALSLGQSIRRAAPLEAAYALSKLEEQRNPVPGNAIPGIMETILVFNQLPLDRQMLQAQAALGEFAEQNPRQAARAAAAMVVQAQYLAGLVPKPAKTPPDAPKVPGVTSRAAQDKFERALAAITDPDGVFEDLANRKIDMLAVQTVRATYPARFAEVRETVKANVAQRDMPLDPYQARMLGLVFGLRVAPEFMPGVGKAAQETLAEPPPEEQERGKMPFVKSTKTEAQSLEAG